MQKVQNMESIDIQSDCKTTCKKRTDSSSVLTCNGKVQKGRERALIRRMIIKQLKDEQVERKQTCAVSFVKVFKFQYNKFKIVQKNL